MLYVCYRCEYSIMSPLLDGVVLHCLGAIRDASNCWKCCVVQLAACRPAPGFCADPSGPEASSLEEMGNSCFELWLHPLAAELVLPHKGRMPLLLTGGMCVFWGEMEDQLLLRSKRPVFFTRHWGLQVAVCGIALSLALCGWSGDCAWQSLLW